MYCSVTEAIRDETEMLLEIERNHKPIVYSEEGSDLFRTIRLHVECSKQFATHSKFYGSLKNAAISKSHRDRLQIVLRPLAHGTKCASYTYTNTYAHREDCDIDEENSSMSTRECDCVAESQIVPLLVVS